MESAALPIAVLDSVIAAQLRENPSEAHGLDVIWSGEDLDDLLGAAPSRSPKVVVADLEKLGDDPVNGASRILAATGAELVVVAYTFARRDQLAEFTGDRVRVVRSPISVSSLKLQMLSVLVRGILGRDVNAPRPPSSRPAPAAAATDVPALPAVAPPRFTSAQLGRLQEVRSVVQCECPNHVASILVSLRAFEDYSRACANRNDDDAAMHRLLYERTAESRRVMEGALERLLEHERITV